MFTYIVSGKIYIELLNISNLLKKYFSTNPIICSKHYKVYLKKIRINLFAKRIFVDTKSIMFQ